MAYTDILPAGTTAATSTDVVVAAGASVKIVAYAAAGVDWPIGLKLKLTIDTPGVPTVIEFLDGSNPKTAGYVVEGEATYNVERPKCSVAVGAMSQ